MSGWLKALLIVGVVVMLLGVLAGTGGCGWKAAQRSGNEAATLQDLKMIAQLEIQYFNTHNRTFGTFDQMANEQMLLDSRFSGNLPIVDGYVFTLRVTQKTTSQPSSYTLNADPQSESTGKNHFYIGSLSGLIHANPDKPAGATDPELGG